MKVGIVGTRKNCPGISGNAENTGADRGDITGLPPRECGKRAGAAGNLSDPDSLYRL